MGLRVLRCDTNRNGCKIGRETILIKFNYLKF